MTTDESVRSDYVSKTFLSRVRLAAECALISFDSFEAVLNQSQSLCFKRKLTKKSIPFVSFTIIIFFSPNKSRSRVVFDLS